VGSWVDGGGNHIEMGLHVFFFNYANLFALMRKVGAFENLLPKDHTHLFVNSGGDLRELDFRFALGAPFNGLKAFFTTPSSAGLTNCAMPWPWAPARLCAAWWITKGR
jgi:zeta-carotene desaturase